MNDRYDSLMQAVLDDVATPGEARELEARIAAEPGARERFEEMRALFDGLRRMPKAHAPEGLVASVLAALPAGHPPVGDDDQLFDTPGVIGASSRNRRDGRSRRGNGFIRVLQPWVFPRGRAMNERNNGMSGNRKIMIGGGLAIAAAAVAVSLGVFPPNSSETAGTIVPAQRYQAPQPQQVDVGTTAGSSSTQTNAAGSQGTLAGQQAGTLAGQQAGTLAGQQAGTLAGQQAGTLAGQQAGTLAGHQAGTLAGQQAGTLAGQQAATLAGQQAGTLAGQQAATLAGQQAGTLAGQQKGMLGQQAGTLAGQQKGMLGQQSATQNAQIK